MIEFHVAAPAKKVIEVLAKLKKITIFAAEKPLN